MASVKNALGNLVGGYQLQQDYQLAQQQMVNAGIVDPQAYFTTGTNTNLSIALSNYATYGYGGDGWSYDKNRPKTNLEWLDDRIAEIRKASGLRGMAEGYAYPA